MHKGQYYLLLVTESSRACCFAESGGVDIGLIDAPGSWKVKSSNEITQRFNGVVFNGTLPSYEVLEYQFQYACFRKPHIRLE